MTTHRVLRALEICWADMPSVLLAVAVGLGLAQVVAFAIRHRAVIGALLERIP